MVEIDNQSGFCFGVVTAIRKAEEELNQGNKLYCLGQIVHNGNEVQRLENLGLITINYQQFTQLHNAKVLLRAHGEPPLTYQIAQQNNIQIIDASCPVVRNLQKKIRKTYEQHPNAQIVIFGKQGHAEVIGLQGQTNNNAIVVEHIQDIQKINLNKDIYLFSQTTKSVDEFHLLIDTLQKQAKANFFSFDTICSQVRNRVQHIRQFAAKHDCIIFVGGQNSSNGKVLFQHCKQVNPNTIFIQSPEELTEDFINNSQNLNIGICGATSTPLWLMQQTKNKLTNNI